ncbi:MAG: phosphoribosylaminoimidazole-succinocarboxamide synthase [Verrucomicrobia bacterium]|nr:MAG: phosphoribosylaminoimidazole-succinocarboxamide synthase [Verrucomicrobiota bacterium]
MLLHAPELPGIPKVASGKVRDIYDLGEHLLLVASDRISAFDCILPTAIPRKGEVLTRLSAFWFEKFDFLENHIVATEFSGFPAALAPFRDQLEGRAMLVKKAQPLPVECVVRGYLAGSGWKEYQATQSVCGIPLSPGLLQAAKLPETLFTPSTKAASGHDENITWSECQRLLGTDIAAQVRDHSIALYETGRTWAASKGILIADTKFEFGLLDGKVILIDECLTPDSSRFWPASKYAPGMSPPSFDKQFVRDYLETLTWDKTPPAPGLPASIVERTSAKYQEAYERLTGAPLPEL